MRDRFRNVYPHFTVIPQFCLFFLFFDKFLNEIAHILRLSLLNFAHIVESVLTNLLCSKVLEKLVNFEPLRFLSVQNCSCEFWYRQIFHSLKIEDGGFAKVRIPDYGDIL